MRTRTTLMASAALLGFALLAVAHAQPPGAKDGVNKCALLVGINTYGKKHTPQVDNSAQWSALEGSHNDVEALQAVLEKRYEFNVHTLLDSDATGEGIRKAFETHLVQCVQSKEDVAFFHYSGHGQQITDQNGDEPDGYDESLVPYDNLGLRDGSRNIRDDDFEKWLARLGERTDNVIVSMDSCHSGTATRSVQTVQARGTTEKQPAAATQNQQDQDAAPGGWVASSNESLRYVFLAAADSHQLAYEARIRTCSDGSKRCTMGRFTQALVQSLWDVSKRRTDGHLRLTYGELMDQVRSQMRRADNAPNAQDPQIVGARKRQLFSTSQQADQVRSHAVPPVKEDGDRKVMIEAGLLHGVEVGAVFSIYSSDEESTKNHPPLAKVRVEELSGSRSYGTAFQVPNWKTTFSKTRRAVQDYSDMQGLLVQLDVPVKGLRSALAGKDHIKLVDPGQGSRSPWQVRVYKDKNDGQVHLETRDGAPIGFPTADPNATGMNESVAWKGKDTAARVAGALQSYFLRGRLLALDNHRADRELRVTLRLERQEAGIGEFEPIASGAMGHFSGTQDQGDKGDKLQIVVESCEPRAVYVSLLEVSPTGLIHHYPFKSAEERQLKAAPPYFGGQPCQPTVKKLLAPMKLYPPYGAYTFKLVATRKAIDLSSLAFTVSDTGEIPDPPTTRSSCDGGLQCLLTTVGPRTRSAQQRDPKEMQWSTSTVSYVIDP